MLLGHRFTEWLVIESRCGKGMFVGAVAATAAAIAVSATAAALSVFLLLTKCVPTNRA